MQILVEAALWSFDKLLDRNCSNMTQTDYCRLFPDNADPGIGAPQYIAGHCQ